MKKDGQLILLRMLAVVMTLKKKSRSEGGHRRKKMNCLKH